VAKSVNSGGQILVVPNRTVGALIHVSKLNVSGNLLFPCCLIY
jgi:hypothetical protein